MCRLALLLFCISVTGMVAAAHVHQQSSQQAVFRRGYEYQSQAKGWMKLHRSPATWFEARKQCVIEGSVLASPLNADIEKAMLAVMGQKAVSIFTGISSTIASGEFFPGKNMSPTPIKNGEFFSVEGVSLDDIPTIWGFEEPGNHHCIAFSRYTLFDADCTQPRPYICYKEDTGDMPQLNQCGTADLEYVYENKTGQCYKFHKHGATWVDAYSVCAREGGYLAVINSKTEADVIKSIIQKIPENTRCNCPEKKSVGIGLLSWDIGGGAWWMNLKGVEQNKAGYGVWVPNGTVPDAEKYEWCGVIDSSGYMSDFSCRTALSFICEMDGYIPVQSSTPEPSDF